MHKSAGGVPTDYVYAGSLLVAEKTGSTVDYMYTDLLGSPIAGNNGSTYKEHYRPWGEKKDDPIQVSDEVGYTGHQSDIETGLTYMQARYYDPVVGRFMAVDPVGFEGRNSALFGRYAYASNNPVNMTDPDGRLPILAPLVVPLVACSLNAACRGAAGFVVGAAIGAATADDGERTVGALKTGTAGAVGAATLKPSLGVAAAAAAGGLDGGYSAANDGDDSTSIVSGAVTQAATDGVSAVGGGVSRFGRDEVEDVVLGAAGDFVSSKVLGSENASQAITNVSEAVSNTPLYPNANEFSLPSKTPRCLDFSGSGCN